MQIVPKSKRSFRGPEPSPLRSLMARFGSVHLECCSFVVTFFYKNLPNGGGYQETACSWALDIVKASQNPSIMVLHFGHDDLFLHLEWSDLRYARVRLLKNSYASESSRTNSFLLGTAAIRYEPTKKVAKIAKFKEWQGNDLSWLWLLQLHPLLNQTFQMARLASGQSALAEPGPSVRNFCLGPHQLHLPLVCWDLWRRKLPISPVEKGSWWHLDSLYVGGRTSMKSRFLGSSGSGPPNKMLQIANQFPLSHRTWLEEEPFWPDAQHQQNQTNSWRMSLQPSKPCVPAICKT